MDYQNKTILITGSYRDIGKSLVSFFAKENANLIITYHLHKRKTEELCNDIKRQFNVNIECQYLDLKDEVSIKKLYSYVKEKYSKIDVLINYSAISRDSHIIDKTKEEFIEVLEVNVVGTFLMMKYFDEIINGYIFNISSTDGIDTGSIYSIDYNASKAGVNSITKTFSLYSKNKIISICPNWVDTTTVREMNREYLISELERVGQNKLINIDTIPKVIDKCIKEKVISGSIIRIDGDDDVRRDS